jgi:hypothetical protein
MKEFNDIEATAEPSFSLKGVKIGGSASMKVMAEVVDATKLSDIDLVKKIEAYEAADIIDLGVPLESSADAVRHAVKVAKSATRKPVSVARSSEYVEAGIGAEPTFLSLDRQRHIGPSWLKGHCRGRDPGRRDTGQPDQERRSGPGTRR